MSREDTDVVSCRSCGEDVVFLLTASGRRMPVNADTVEAGDVYYEAGKHVSHFSTCDQPDRFRKPR